MFVCLLTDIMTCSRRFSTVCMSVFWLSLWLVLGGRLCLSVFWLSWEMVLEGSLSLSVCLLTAIMTGSWRYIMAVFVLTFMRNGSWRFIVSVCILTYNTVWLGSHRCRISLSSDFLDDLTLEATICTSSTVQYVCLQSSFTTLLCGIGRFFKK
jgi:hypothetical protein